MRLFRQCYAPDPGAGSDVQHAHRCGGPGNAQVLAQRAGRRETDGKIDSTNSEKNWAPSSSSFTRIDGRPERRWLEVEVEYPLGSAAPVRVRKRIVYQMSPGDTE